MTGKHISRGQGALRPYLYVRPDMIEFVQHVFGGEILARHDMPSGSHVEVLIEDSVLVLVLEAAESFPDHASPTIYRGTETATCLPSSVQP